MPSMIFLPTCLFALITQCSVLSSLSREETSELQGTCRMKDGTPHRIVSENPMQGTDLKPPIAPAYSNSKISLQVCAPGGNSNEDTPLALKAQAVSSFQLSPLLRKPRLSNFLAHVISRSTSTRIVRNPRCKRVACPIVSRQRYLAMPSWKLKQQPTTPPLYCLPSPISCTPPLINWGGYICPALTADKVERTRWKPATHK